MIVSVVGACGHVGFPFSVVAAEAGHTVYGIDLVSSICDKLNAGHVPFTETGIEKPFKNVLASKALTFTTKTTSLIKSDVVAIMIGTPVDAENNPRLDELHTFIRYGLCDHIKKGQLIILRSTVCPGTTEVIRDMIEEETRRKEGVDFHLVFCPERVAQGCGYEESKKFPQLIGAFDSTGFEKAKEFFTFVSDCIWLSPKEAEMGKLMTNMYRYVNFALANEFYMLGDKQGVDMHRVIAACNKDYPRMNMPLPGPNVSGPCLYKDGRYLLTDVPYADLINTSFLINEGMPDFIFNRISSLSDRKIKKILILGMTFKADCDDTRNSLSFKMRKVAKKYGCKTLCHDPYIPSMDKEIDCSDADAVVLMTPHKEYRTWLTNNLNFLRHDTVIVDIWKHFDETKKLPIGIYRACNLTDPSAPLLTHDDGKRYE